MDLATVITECVDNITEEELQDWILAEGKPVVSMILVKEYMIGQLDNNNML